MAEPERSATLPPGSAGAIRLGKEIIAMYRTCPLVRSREGCRPQLQSAAVEQGDILCRFVEGGFGLEGDIASQRISAILPDRIVGRRETAAVPGVVESIRPVQFLLHWATPGRQVVTAACGEILSIRAEEHAFILDIRKE